MLLMIYDLLHRLGASANYIGFFQAAYAIKLCVENPERLTFVTKDLYPDVAKQNNTNWRAVERNIRTLCGEIWKNNPELLQELAQWPLDKKPSATRFLSIISCSVALRYYNVSKISENCDYPLLCPKDRNSDPAIKTAQ